MPRRVWIISKKEKIEDNDIANATLNSCSEIANGIPLALQKIIKGQQLPIAYEEANIPCIPPRDLIAEIDNLKVRISKLENTLTS